MKIALLAPSHKSFISGFLPNVSIAELPEGYNGAPFIGILITELLALGHSVIAITTSTAIINNYQIKEFSNGNFKWIVVPARKHTLNFNAKKLGKILDFYALEQKAMKLAILENHPDFVHAHWSYEFAGAAIKSKLPSLITVHDNAFQVAKYFKNAYRLGRLLMSELILRKIKYASTVSPYMLPYVKARCHTVRVISNPVNVILNETEVLATIQKRLTSQYFKIVMIMNGWDKRKNGKVGVEAFDLIKKEFPLASLHLYGNATESAGIAYKDCENVATKDVFFHGSLPHPKLLSEISNAHVLLHTALEESFGVVLIEAMSQGIPAIGGIHSGAVPWVIDDATLLVDVTRPLAIKNKIIELLINKTLYKNTALKCYNNTVSRFSAKAVVSNYVNYYNDILNNNTN